MTAPHRSTPEEMEARFRDLCRDGGLEQPDECEYDPAAEELTFLWNEQKLAVIVELVSRTSPPPPV